MHPAHGSGVRRPVRVMSSAPQETLPPPRPAAGELRDRAKAAKFRHKAAKAKLKAHNLRERAARLEDRASAMETRADQLDGVLRPPPSPPLPPDE